MRITARISGGGILLRHGGHDLAKEGTVSTFLLRAAASLCAVGRLRTMLNTVH